MTSIDPHSSSQQSGVTLSWPVFFMVLIGVAGVIFWATRQAVNAEEIGEVAGESAAEVFRDQTDEIIEEAVAQTMDKMMDRTGEIADRVLGGAVEDTIGRIEDRTPSGNESSSEGGLIGSVFDVLETAKDEVSSTIVDMGATAFPISVDQEWEIGEQIGDALRKEMIVVTDSRLQQRIDGLAQPVLARLERTAGRQYRITIMENDMVNAFAILGGQIFIATGLIDRMENDAAIQSVIAHEIAHVEVGHCVKGSWARIKTQETLGANVISTVLTDMSQFVALGFSEDQEFESDEYAFRTQYHFGSSRMERVHFVGVLLELENTRIGHDHQESENPIEAMIERHYRTHPPASDRVSRLLNMPDDPSKP